MGPLAVSTPFRSYVYTPKRSTWQGKDVELASGTKKLTTVSYGILGLLGLRPHTPYELAQQFRRSGTFWAAAESVVYNEPKALVAHGLAMAAAETSGGRRRTRYSITPAGRREL